MGEFFKTVADVLAAIFPDSNFGKLVALLILVFLVLVVTGRFKLEWLGTGIRHIYRWLRCKIRDKHHYRQHGFGRLDWDTGDEHATFVCYVCGKVRVV